MNDREHLVRLVGSGNRFRQTPIVDDDFPSLRDGFDWDLRRATIHLSKPRPTIVTLCGSTRFAEAYRDAQRSEALAGRLVFSVGLLGHTEGLDMNGPVKAALDELHKRKIDQSDEILVLNVGGYIGSSTRSEIEYAIALGKRVRYLEPIEGDEKPRETRTP